MATGVQHAAASLVLSPVTGLGVYAMTHNAQYAAIAAAACVAGIALTPDLDQEGLSKFEYKLIRYTLGIGFLWPAFWGLYSVLIPHRSPLSHWPLLGTSLRLCYMLILLYIIPGLRPGVLNAVGADWFAYAVLGLLISDIAHWIMDGFPGAGRKRKKIRGR